MRSVKLLAVVVLTVIAAALSIQSAFAASSISLTVAPNPAPEGGGATRVTFSGTEVPAKGGSTIYIGIFGYGSCTYEPFITRSTTELSSGYYALVLTTGDIGTIGQYSAIAFDPATNALSACQSFTITPGAPPPTVTPVGGVVMPANTLALVSPWLAVIGLVGCIGIVVFVKKHRTADPH